MNATRQCTRLVLRPNNFASRTFATSSALRARPSGSKSKKPLQDEVDESMTIRDAAAVLKAVEVGLPSTAYEITITTKYTRGQAAPRGKISLPKDARAKSETILVFANGKHADAAREAGAHYVGGEELIPEILSGAILPTKVIATPTLLPAIQKQLARFLGPKGLMPAEKRGTVTLNIEPAVKQAQGTMNWKGDRLGVIRAPVARIGWPIDEVEANVRAFVAAVKEGTTEQDGDVTIGKKKRALS